MTILSDGDVWQSLARIEFVVESVRPWTPEQPPPNELIRGMVGATRPLSSSHSTPGDPRPILRKALTKGTPGDLSLPDHTPVRPHLSDRIDLALRKYLAARLIAGWVSFQADDLRTVVNYLHLCVKTVLMFEGARRSTEREEDRFKEAIRSADLWILHYCDPELLALNLR